MQICLRRSASGLLVCLMLNQPAHASILADVLFRIDLMGSSPLAAIMVNLAENASSPVTQVQRLEANQSAIIGYDANGLAVEAVAGAAGVLVTAAMAEMLQTGLKAGLYPVGSQLYDLPPAGQLSLFEQARDGAQLAKAQALLMSRIDGSITNVITGVAFPELAPAALTRVYSNGPSRDLLSLTLIDATALGAVNSGQIVTNVAAEWQTGAASAELGLSLAEISAGASMEINEAINGQVQAVSFTAHELGGTSRSSALLLNQATNASEIVARILTVVQDQQVALGNLTTTAIGAINAGSVNPSQP